jgi:alpha/beta superfamily hydrolase
MERITFATDDGVTLEADLWSPDGAGRGAAVICHAHPKFGGSKDYPLLWAIRIDLRRRGFGVLAFNFRGVMGSQGTHGGGRDEVADVRAAVDRASKDSAGPVVVCGWSFGANVALRSVVDDERVAALALIGMPLAGSDPDLPPLPDEERLAAFTRPTLLLAGSDDLYCPEDALRALGSRFARAEVQVVSGADHYFSRQERDAATRVGDFAERVLAGGTPQ